MLVLRGDVDGDLFVDAESEAFEAEEFFGAVGHDAEFCEAEVAEDLGADAEVSAIHDGGAGGMLGAFLKFVEAVEECEAAGFLAEVDEGAFAGILDHFERGGEFLAGGGAPGAKDVAQEMF